MSVKMISAYYYAESICICGHNFGFWSGGTGYQRFVELERDGMVIQRYMSFWQIKQEHFKERHPRRLSMGKIV